MEGQMQEQPAQQQPQNMQQAQAAQAAQASQPQGQNPQMQQALQIGMAIMQNPVQAIMQILQGNPQLAQQVMEMAGVVPKQQVDAQMNEMKAQQLSEKLDQIFPNWRDYAQEIAATLEQAPQLANDPRKLLKVALPDEVLAGEMAAGVQKDMASAETQAQAATAPAYGGKPYGYSEVEAAKRLGVIS